MTDSAAAAPVADDILPISAAAAGVLALAGGAYMLTRRRRREEEEFEAAPEVIETDHVARAEPASALVFPAVTSTTLPAGMDLSRYGRHAQAAYRGPTPDNPSLSLRKRLKRARFFDQRERMAREGMVGSEAVPVPTPATQAARAPAAPPPRRTVAHPPSQPFGSFRPAFQS